MKEGLERLLKETIKMKEEVREILSEYGLSEETQVLVANEMANNKTKWIEFIMRFELGLEEPHVNRARNSAATIGIAYIVGGIIPLSAYMFTDLPTTGLAYSSILTIICLFIFGYYKSKVTGQDAFKGAVKVTFIGIIAATAAFGVAKWFDAIL